jgi:LysR family transcriptional regulator, hypochlorite-specific transcription factor HypT
MGPVNRPLDMEWLEDFLALADTGNFSRAAESRAIAQPAFSRHIRSLEEWVGVDLIDRASHPVELTAAGRKFQPLIAELLASLEAARYKARAAHDLSAASLRFASTHSLSLTFFPQWLCQLESKMRLGPIQTMSDSSQVCEDLMAQRRVQFLLCYGHPEVKNRLDEGQYPVTQLGEDELVPVCAPDAHGRALFSLETSGMVPLLEYSEASGLGRIMRSELKPLYAPSAKGRGVPNASVVFTAHNAFLIKSMAMQGKGVAWLPQTLIADDLQSGKLAVAAPEAWTLRVQIRLYRQKSEMTPAAEELWTLVSESTHSGL